MQKKPLFFYKYDYIDKKTLELIKKEKVIHDVLSL